MDEDWALRIRNYRERSGLTQDALAEMFLVDSRTVRRWEAGKTRPPLDVRRRLGRTHVPIIQTPVGSVLRDLVERSADGITLLDDDLKVLAQSARDIRWTVKHYGRDLRGEVFMPYLPSFFEELAAPFGGWHGTVRAGLASLTCDFRMPVADAGNAADYSGRLQYTVLRLADGVRVHLCVASKLQSPDILHPPQLTFVDEIMSSE